MFAWKRALIYMHVLVAVDVVSHQPSLVGDTIVTYDYSVSQEC